MANNREFLLENLLVLFDMDQKQIILFVKLKIDTKRDQMSD